MCREQDLMRKCPIVFVRMFRTIVVLNDTKDRKRSEESDCFCLDSFRGVLIDERDKWQK